MTENDVTAQILAGAEQIKAGGASKPRAGRDPINMPMIRNWLEAIGDENPIYVDEDAAVALANDTTFGLGSYVFTTDAEQADRVANRLNVGMVYVNLVLADAPELPFGGVKSSGTGRELGTLAADEFVNKKLIRTA